MLAKNCLIVEDEPLAARVIADHISQVPGLRLIAICEDAMSAMVVLRQESVDIIFMDINLPKLSGLEFIKTLNDKYDVIITSAYHQYAIAGFDLDVIDYLLKPISFERFLKSVNRVFDFDELRQGKNLGEGTKGFIFVKTSNGLEKIKFSDILFIEALQNYVTIQTVLQKIVTHSSLKNVVSFLPAIGFVKVQKSFVVAVDKIDRIDGNMIIVGKHAISMSRNNKEEVLNTILQNRVLKR